MRYLTMRYMPLLAAGLAVVAMTTLCIADQTKPSDGAQRRAEAEAEGIEVEAEEVEPKSAGAINFMDALEFPLESLLVLGGRIERARFVEDPIGLATAAQLLAAAEKASGKKAPLTSEDVLQESISMAKNRRQAEELAILAALIEDPTISQELQELEQLTRTEAEEATAAAEAGEEDKYVGRLLIVNQSNRQRFRVRVGWGPNAQHAFLRPGERRMFFNVHGRSVRAVSIPGGRERRYSLPHRANFYRIGLRGGPWGGPGGPWGWGGGFQEGN